MMLKALKILGWLIVVGLAAFAIVSVLGGAGMFLEAQVHQHQAAELALVQPLAFGGVAMGIVAGAGALGITVLLRRVRKEARHG